MKLLLENWREYQLKEDLLSRPVYITGVLGVQLPLMEDGVTIRPFTAELTEEILREQLLFEGFWGELLQKGTEKLLDATEGIKQFGKEAWAVLSAMYKVANEGADKIVSFTNAIAKKGINKMLNTIKEVLSWLVQKLPGWGMPTFSDWAQKALNAILRLVGTINDLSGWKKVVSVVGLAIGLHWLWDKVGGWFDELKEKVASLDPRQQIKDEILGPIKEWIKETAMEKLQEIGGDTFKKLMETLATAWTGVKPWWDAAVKVAGGVKLVVNALGPGAARFMSREAHFDQVRARHAVQECLNDDYLENWHKYLMEVDTAK
jgi:hypothetical protein